MTDIIAGKGRGVGSPQVKSETKETEECIIK